MPVFLDGSTMALLERNPDLEWTSRCPPFIFFVCCHGCSGNYFTGLWPGFFTLSGSLFFPKSDSSHLPLCRAASPLVREGFVHFSLASDVPGNFSFILLKPREAAPDRLLQKGSFSFLFFSSLTDFVSLVAVLFLSFYLNTEGSLTVLIPVTRMFFTLLSVRVMSCSSPPVRVRSVPFGCRLRVDFFEGD